MFGLAGVLGELLTRNEAAPSSEAGVMQRTPHTVISPQCRQFCEGESFARGDFEKLQRGNNSVQRENGKDEISEKELCREDLWWPCCPTRELLNVCGC